MIPDLVKGGFYHAGQVCVSVQKVYVNQKICDRFIEQFSEAAQNALATVSPIRRESVRLQGEKERGSHFVERRRRDRDDTPTTDHSHVLTAIASSPSSSPSCSTSSDSPSSCD